MKKFLIIFTAVIIVMAILTVINAFYCRNTLEINNIEVNSDRFTQRLRIVLISDQHNVTFGENDSKLIAKIKEQKPDIIAVCGDMTNSGTADDSVMKNLLSNLSEIAPTYFALGNHERELSDKIDFRADIETCGAVLLDNSSVTLTKGGESYLLGGLSDFPYYDTEFPDYDTPERYYWEAFNEAAKDKFSILLHHQPEYIPRLLDDSNIDLVLCGHTHGGAVKIPFIGGLYAPNQGFFPKYDFGEYDFNGTKMIITSGLGFHEIPRINNCAQITVIDIG